MKPIQAAILERGDERNGAVVQLLDVVLDTEGNVIKNRWGPVTGEVGKEAGGQECPRSSQARPQRFRWSEPVVCGCGVEEVRGYLKVDAGNTMAVLTREAEGTWQMMSAFVPDALELMEGGMDLEGAKELAEYFLDQWIQTTGRVLR